MVSCSRLPDLRFRARDQPLDVLTVPVIDHAEDEQGQEAAGPGCLRRSSEGRERITGESDEGGER
jgi:hypothetical protein